MADPVCLVQWLKSGEYREADAAWAAFAKSINIAPSSVSSKATAIDAIRAWLLDNSNSQFLYIGTHGVYDSKKRCMGLGKDGVDVLMWSELAKLLLSANVKPVLWLGACGSSAIADSWNASGVGAPAAWIVSFDEPILPNSCEAMLKKCLDNTSTDSIVYVDQELPALRAALPNVGINLFYPAVLSGGQTQYISADDFPVKLGVTLEEYLKKHQE